MDLTRVSPPVGLRVGAFTVEQTALKAASSKVAKHEKACSITARFSLDLFLIVLLHVICACV